MGTLDRKQTYVSWRNILKKHLVNIHQIVIIFDISGLCLFAACT